MSDRIEGDQAPISPWRAHAALGGRGWTDAAYGFGGPDVAEAVGTADEIGAELTHFLNGLGWQEVEAARLRTGQFFIRLEVEPHEQGASSLVAREAEDAGEDRVLQWEANASAGNGRGVFDACYSFGNCQGDEGHLVGTAQEVGAELSRVLNELTRDGPGDSQR